MITTCQILFQHDARIKEQLSSDSVSEFSNGNCVRALYCQICHLLIFTWWDCHMKLMVTR